MLIKDYQIKVHANHNITDCYFFLHGYISHLSIEILLHFTITLSLF